jgi:hypothetical protein
MTVVLLAVAVIFGLTGLLFFFGSVMPTDRWPSRSHRLIAMITGATMLAVAGALAAAGATSGSTRRDLLLVAGPAAIAGAVGRWLVRWRWEVGQQS